MSSPKTLPITVYQGDDFALLLRFAHAFVEAKVTNGSDVIEATCRNSFKAYHIGAVIRGEGVPDATTIISVAADGSEAIMSVVATSTVPNIDTPRYFYAIGPYDLSTYLLFKAQARRQPRWDDPALFAFTITRTDDADGELLMSAAHALLDDIPKDYWWDFQATDAANHIHTFFRGPVDSGREITRP